MLPVKFANTFVHFLKPDSIGVPHRSTAVCREAVPVDEDDVDVDCAKCIAFFEDPSAFVDERIDATIDDFVGQNRTLWNSALRSPFANNVGDCRIGTRISVSSYLYQPA